MTFASLSRAVSAADANREFSALLRRVKGGQEVVITSHGRPVARMVPVRDGDVVVQSARAALFGRLRAARARAIPRWSRDQLYD